MNQGIKVFFVLFSAFVIILILNAVEQANTGWPGDWAAITTNFIGFLPYVGLIFFGLFYALVRGRKE